MIVQERTEQEADVLFYDLCFAKMEKVIEDIVGGKDPEMMIRTQILDRVSSIINQADGISDYQIVDSAGVWLPGYTIVLAMKFLIENQDCG